MEEQQVPPSQPAYQTLEAPITPEQLAEIKARARAAALQQAVIERQVQPPVAQQPQIVYVRRNLTVAELLLVLLLSCGILTGIQWTWNMVSNIMPRIEIKVR